MIARLQKDTIAKSLQTFPVVALMGTIQGTQYPLLIRSGLADTASFSKRKTS